QPATPAADDSEAAGQRDRSFRHPRSQGGHRSVEGYGRRCGQTVSGGLNPAIRSSRSHFGQQVVVRNGACRVKVIRVNFLGGPEVLTTETAPEPVPGPGQVVVQLEAIGVNFIDTYFRRGLYKSAVPFVPGQEGAGTVRLIGAGVTSVAIGDRVAYTGI